MIRLRSLWRSLWYFRSGDFEVTIRLRQPLTALVSGLVIAWYIISRPRLPPCWQRPWRAVIMHLPVGARDGPARLRFAQAALRRFQVGDELEEQVHVDNDSMLPGLWIELVDRSHIPGYSIAEARAVDGSGSNEWTTSTICGRRGVFRLGPWELHLGDPFGVFEVIQVYGKQEEIVVYPPLAVLPPPCCRTRSRWAATARCASRCTPSRSWPTRCAPTRPATRCATFTGRPARAVRSSSSSSSIPSLPPMSGSCPTWTPPSRWALATISTLERMIILAASLASHLLQEQLAVGLVAFPDLPWQPVLPQRSPAHLWTILRALAPLEASRQPLAEMLARVPAWFRARIC